MKKRLFSLCCAFMLCVTPCTTVFADYDDWDDDYEDWDDEEEEEGGPYENDEEYSPTGKCGNNVSYVLDEKNGILTIKGTGEMWDSAEPYAYATYTPWIKEYEWIGEFDEVVWNEAAISNIKKIVIEEGVTRIAWGAFHGLRNLTSVSIPSTVYEISAMSFAGCTALKEINIPETVEIIGYGAFHKTAWYDAQPEGTIIINHTVK